MTAMPIFAQRNCMQLEAGKREYGEYLDIKGNTQNESESCQMLHGWHQLLVS